MNTPEVKEKLQGIVEIDECFIGGKEANKHLDEIVKAVLSYKPKPKSKAAKRRERRKKREAENRNWLPIWFRN